MSSNTSIRRLNNREISSFCSQISMLQQAGISPSDGMRILMTDSESRSGRHIYETIYKHCLEGDTFYESVKSSELFPEYVLNMIKLGEESGNLETVMQSLSDYYEREELIADNLKSAITYPMVMTFMMFLVIIVLITKVLPIFNQVFVQLGTEMTGVAGALMNIGKQINRYAVFFLGLLLILFSIYVLSIKTKFGKKLSHKLLNVFPATRRLYENVAVGRFASGMVLTYSSGMELYHGLDLVSDLVEHKEVKAKILKCKKILDESASFPEAISQANIFSNFYTHMLAVGFQSGSTEAVMKKISYNYDNDINKQLQKLVAILEPTLVIILSLIVGLILLSVILPLMGIMSGIG